MSQKVPAIFEDSTGTIARLTGELETFGSLALSANEQIEGNAVTIANGASAPLTWDTLTAGEALLDLTTKTAPTVITAGVYAVTIYVTPGAITHAGYYTLGLSLDADAADANQFATSPASSAANASPVIGCTNVFYVPAGGVIQATVGNFDSAASVAFTLTAAIQAL